MDHKKEEEGWTTKKKKKVILCLLHSIALVEQMTVRHSTHYLQLSLKCLKCRGLLQKRKLSDLLGSQWSKAELERFYEAYRKYGTDWKKVGLNLS